MLDEKLNKKVDYWLNSTVSEEAKKIREETVEKTFNSIDIYEIITTALTKYLKSNGNDKFVAETSIPIRLPEGEWSPVDIDYFIKEGVRLYGFRNYSLPLLMEKLAEDRIKFEAKNNIVDWDFRDTDGKNPGQLLIKVEIQKERVNVQEEQQELVIEEAPKLTKTKKNLWQKLFKK